MNHERKLEQKFPDYYQTYYKPRQTFFAALLLPDIATVIMSYLEGKCYCKWWWYPVEQCSFCGITMCSRCPYRIVRNRCVQCFLSMDHPNSDPFRHANIQDT